MNGPKVAVVSAFEAKLQPILAAGAAGALRSAGAQVSAWDADVCPNDFPGGGFDLVLISIPSYEGIEPGAQLASRFKQAGVPRVLVCGQYAWLNAGVLAAVTDGDVVPLDDDVASRWGHAGWRLYLGFILAGVSSNAAAFLVRGVAKAGPPVGAASR